MMLAKLASPATQPLLQQALAAVATQAPRHFFTVVDQFESGVTLTLGKFTGEKGPGLRLRLPFVQQMAKVDMRTRSIDIPPQHLMTADNVSVHVDAVAFLRVVDARKSVCEVNNPTLCVAELAQAHLRDELSHSTLEAILHKRGEFSERILSRVAEKASPWGIEVQDIKLKNISVDEAMVRALAKKAEAERERQARNIIADAEVNTAHKLAQAAATLKTADGAMHLRELQTYLEIAQEKGSTIVLPSNLGRFLGGTV